MRLRHVLSLLGSLLVVAPAPAAAGGFIFGFGAAGLAVAGSGAGTAAVGGLALVLPHGGSAGAWSAEPSFFLVEASPTDAQVTVDGRAVGTARERSSFPLNLPPGIHTITIEAPGHQSITRHFRIDGSGFVARMRVALAPLP
jgi:hypothetical protein